MYRIKVLFLTVITVIFLLFTAVGCREDDVLSDGADYSFTYTLTSNPANLDPQLATDEESLMIIQNMFQGLMAYNENGELTTGAASGYRVSDDGLKYTFTMRENCYWYLKDGKATTVKARDFVFAFQRIFNPDMQSPYRETFICLKNANKIINGEMDYQKIGVYTNDNDEVVFELDTPNANFLNLLTTSPAMPCNETFFEYTKARYGLDDESTASNGAFYISKWFYDKYGKDNFISMQRNELNSESDKVYPYSLKFIIESSEENSNSNFKDGITDCIVSDKEYKDTFTSSYDVSKYEVSSAGIIFNLNDEIFSNEKFRKAFSLSIDRESFSKKLPHDYSAAYGIIPSAVTILNKSYRQLCSEKSLCSYNSSEAKAAYSEGLTEMGISKLENIRMLIRKGSIDENYIMEIVNQWEDIIGVFVELEFADEDEYYEKLSNGSFQMTFWFMESESNDAYEFLEIFRSGNFFGYGSLETDTLLDDSRSAVNLNECLEIYSQIEKSVIQESVYIPVLYKKRYFTVNENIEGLVYNPFTNQIDFRFAKNFSLDD